jgi:hypothetical protein
VAATSALRLQLGVITTRRRAWSPSHDLHLLTSAGNDHGLPDDLSQEQIVDLAEKLVEEINRKCQDRERKEPPTPALVGWAVQ